MTTLVDVDVRLLSTGLVDYLESAAAAGPFAVFPFQRQVRTTLTPRTGDVLLKVWINGDDDTVGDVTAGCVLQTRAPLVPAGVDPVLDMSNHLRAAMCALRDTQLSNGVPITSAWRERGTDLPVDPAGMYEWVDTFTIVTNRRASS